MAEVLHGYASADLLNARADKSQVYGLKGNDTLTSDNKSDVLLVGGSGSDSLIISGGNGTLSGGEGSDTFELTYSADKKLSAVIEDLIPTEDKIVVNFDGSTAPQISSSVSGNDVILRDGAGNFNVTLKGVRDNDYFDGTLSEQAWEVLKFTNAEREKKNLSALTLSEGLTAGASIRAQEITSLGVLGLLTNHTRPDDKGNYDTVFKEVGKEYLTYGENLDGGAATPQEVVEQWMSSNSHKENILKTAYKKIGVGYNYDDPDPTNHRYYWTQLFADSLNNPETVSTAELLTANPQVGNIVSKTIKLTEGNDTRSNSEYGATINALGGNDSIQNTALLASISGGAGTDTLQNSGSFVTIRAGAGNDSIRLSGGAKENVITRRATATILSMVFTQATRFQSRATNTRPPLSAITSSWQSAKIQSPLPTPRNLLRSTSAARAQNFTSAPKAQTV